MKQLLILLLICCGLYASAQKDTTVTFKVSGLCSICKDRIEETAKGKGVQIQCCARYYFDSFKFIVAY